MSVDKYRARLREVDAQIDKISTQILSDVAESVRSSAVDSQAPTTPKEWLSPKLRDTLWLVKNGFDEAKQLLQLGHLAPCAQSLDRLSKTVAEFEQEYPNALLTVDLSRKLDELKKEYIDAVNKSWHEIIKLTGESLTVHVEDAEKAEFVLQSSSRLTESFVQRAFGEALIEPIINQEIAVSAKPLSLSWKPCSNPSVSVLADNIASLVRYCQSLPKPLCEAIPRRWGTYFISSVLQKGMSKLYPDEKSPDSFKVQLSAFLDLEKELKNTGWISTREISHFVSNFDTRWLDIRRESFLLKLRELYRQSQPFTEEQRELLIVPSKDDEEEEPSSQQVEGDGWDWNEEDEETEEEEKPVSAEGKPGSQGQLIDLWQAYRNELTISDPEPFFALYRAVAAVAYDTNHLWAYSDTVAFVRNITKQQGINVDQLLTFAHENLRKFVVGYMDTLKYDILPDLFGRDPVSEAAIAKLRSLIDSVAMATNDAGGTTLRHMVLSQLLEQTAVYISDTILEFSDIGEDESQRLAIVITKVSALAVYVEDPSGSIPSWTKLDLLRQLLTTNLATIEDLFNRGSLADFDQRELTQLIKALFRDSGMRSQLLRSIAQS